MPYKFVFSLFIAFLSFTAHAEDLIQIRSPQGAGDASHAYYAELLDMALEATSPTHGEASVIISPLNVSQGRAFKLLKGSGRLDAEFAGANQHREDSHHVVRVPLTMGLLGTRMLVINKHRINDFDQISSAAQLKKLNACQGAHWPDSDILEANGYKVVRSPIFEHMWKMLEQGKCDYFPRALIEGYGEVAHFGDDKFHAYDKILLSYRFPMYFFFADNMAHMAQRVTKGLHTLLEQGQLQAFLETHPVTSAAFPLTKYKDSQKFALNNQDISPKTQALDSRFWLALD